MFIRLCLTKVQSGMFYGKGEANKCRHNKILGVRGIFIIDMAKIKLLNHLVVFLIFHVWEE